MQQTAEKPDKYYVFRYSFLHFLTFSRFRHARINRADDPQTISSSPLDPFLSDSHDPVLLSSHYLLSAFRYHFHMVFCLPVFRSCLPISWSRWKNAYKDIYNLILWKYRYKAVFLCFFGLKIFSLCFAGLFFRSAARSAAWLYWYITLAICLFSCLPFRSGWKSSFPFLLFPVFRAFLPLLDRLYPVFIRFFPMFSGLKCRKSKKSEKNLLKCIDSVRLQAYIVSATRKKVPWKLNPFLQVGSCWYKDTAISQPVHSRPGSLVSL